jgi:hypothetical protein
VLELAMQEPQVEPAPRAPPVVELGMPRVGARSSSPRATRRRSRAACTPPGTPDPVCSSTAVCPSPPSSLGSCPPVLLLSRGHGSAAAAIAITPFDANSASIGAQHALDLIAPTSSSISCPPGLSSSPTARTPSLVDGLSLDLSGSPSPQLVDRPRIAERATDPQPGNYGLSCRSCRHRRCPGALQTKGRPWRA